MFSYWISCYVQQNYISYSFHFTQFEVMIWALVWGRVSSYFIEGSTLLNLSRADNYSLLEYWDELSYLQSYR